jgi:putative CocE/NonD family hydrolase
VQAATAQATPSAPEENYVKSHYTKYEYRIPMRDGVHLFTSVYVPKDSSESYPFLVTRTPYSVEPYGEDQYPKRLGPSDEFENAGYIFVYQDVRGRYMSEGTFVEMRPHIDLKKSPKDIDDSSDMYDTLEFLLHRVPGNNGKAGIVGISYPGFYTSASMIDSHPALKAASPQAPMTDLFMGDDSYHGGAFMLDANFGFYSSYFKPFSEPSLPQPSTSFAMGTPNHYEFYLKAGPLANLDKRYLKGSNPLFNDQMYHDTYDDYWKARDLAPHLKNVKCAVLVVGGWYDAEDLSGPYRTFNAVNQYNPETPITLVEGPWTHGGWARRDGDHLGDIEFNAKTSDYFRKKIQFPFFEYYLKGKGAPLPKAQVSRPEATSGVPTMRGRRGMPRPKPCTSTPREGSRLSHHLCLKNRLLTTSTSATPPTPCRSPDILRMGSRSATWSMTSASPPLDPTCSLTKPNRSLKMSPSPALSRPNYT